MAQDLDAELDDLELRKNLGSIRTGAIRPSGRRRPRPPPPPLTIPRLPGPPAAGSISGAAAARAAKLASDAMALELAQAAGDPAASRETMRLLLAHQVAAGHYRRRASPPSPTPTSTMCSRRRCAIPISAAARRRRCAWPMARRGLMERVRAAALALQRLGYPAAPIPICPRRPGRRGRRNIILIRQAPGQPAAAPASMPHPRGRPSPMRRGRLNNGNPSGDFLAAPRCGASTRAGHSCAQPAMRNGRCRFHGGREHGPAHGLRHRPRPQRAAGPRLPQWCPDQAAERGDAYGPAVEAACPGIAGPLLFCKARNCTRRREDAKKSRFQAALLSPIVPP